MPDVLVYLILATPLVGAYALYAIGIVVIYQASRVVNLAHGAMAMVPAYIVYTLVESWGMPMGVGFLIGVASGAAIGVGVERFFVRRLRRISPAAQTVGTVAALGLLVPLAAKIWGTSALRAPRLFPEGHVSVGSSILLYGQIGLTVVAVVTAAALFVFFQRTELGLAMRGSAQNRRAASLMGIDPDLSAAGAWALGGALAGLAGILLAPVSVLHPYTLALSVLPAYVAALIGGMSSLPATLIGASVLGAVLGFVPLVAPLPGFRVVFGQSGGEQLVLAATAMVVMATRGQRFVATSVRGDVL
jgi:branched-subunit amino acid ABC-type transport system permease component